MLHLCRCKRYAGREKVEEQAPHNIGILCLCSWRSASRIPPQAAKRLRQPGSGPSTRRGSGRRRFTWPFGLFSPCFWCHGALASLNDTWPTLVQSVASLRALHWFPSLKELLCVRESESHTHVVQLPSARPCTLIVAPMRVLFLRKKIAAHNLPKLLPQAIAFHSCTASLSLSSLPL